MSDEKRSVVSKILGARGSIAQRRNEWLTAAGAFERAAERRPRDASLWFKAGNAYFRAGEDLKAVPLLERANALSAENSEWRYRLGFVLEKTRQYRRAIEEYDYSERLGGYAPRLAYRRGRCFADLGEADNAKVEYLCALAAEFQPKKSYEALRKLEGPVTPVWQKLDLRRQGQEYFEPSESWTVEHARLADKMGDSSEAVQFYGLVSTESALSAKDRLAFAINLERVGNDEDSCAQLEQLVSMLPEQERPFHSGAVFQKHGMWDRARAALEELNVPDALEPERLYRIGFTYDREYRWAEALKYFELAVRLRPDEARWHYKAAHASERLGDYARAVGSYLQAVELDPKQRHWWYRAGVCLNSVGDDAAALYALLRSMKGATQVEAAGTMLLPGPSPTDAYLRANAEERAPHIHQHLGALSNASPDVLVQWADVAKRAGFNDDAHMLLNALPLVGSELTGKGRQRAVELMSSLGDRRESIELALEDRIFRRPDGVNTAEYMRSEQDRRNRVYAEFLTTRPINSQVVLFESNHGASVGCHPLAIYRQMRGDDRFRNCSFVWAVNDSSSVPSDVKKDLRVVMVKVHSTDYLRHLATAKYLINNVSFAPYFVRRPEQRYLNTWHGTPMKTLGRSMRQGIIEYENLERNFLQATHIMAPNELTRWALIDEHHLDGIYPGATMITGSPRLDRLVRDNGELRAKIRTQLGVLESERMILVAPTWRGGVSSRDLDADALAEELGTIASIPGTRVFYRAHRLTESMVKDLSLPAEIVPAAIDTNDLLAAVDHLVTDYSSISFDFLPTGRPVTLYVPDEVEYVADRGLYVLPEELPFGVARTIEELKGAVADPIVDVESYTAAQELYGPLEDGHASERCVDFFVSDKLRGNEFNGNRTLVFHASMIPNGIAASARALFQELVTLDLNVVLIVEPKVLRRDARRWDQIERLPKKVKLVSRVGDLVLTPEDAYVRSRVESLKFQPGEVMLQQYRAIWRREARRLLGVMHVDVAIEWDGYAALWANIILGSGNDETFHVIWQHNDMALERSEKFPELDNVFAVYPDFDRVVSVSDSLREINAQYLEQRLGLPSSRVHSVHNVVPVNEILLNAQAPLDDDIGAFLVGASKVVVNVGRMSPEKNQSALLEAWKVVHDTDPDARLLIVGTGPLEAELWALASKLGIGDSMMFTGQRSNALPIIGAADLFVLPSLHEGQPVVLFEAMALGVPILASDLPGNVEAIQAGYGTIIGNTPSDIAFEINRALSEPRAADNLVSLRSYATHAVAEFGAVVDLVKETQPGPVLHEGNPKK